MSNISCFSILGKKRA